MHRAIYCDRRDSAGVDELRNTGSLRGVEKVLRAADVRVVNFAFALGPKAVIGRNMEYARNAVDRPCQRCGIAQIAGDVFEGQIGNGAIVARSTKQDAYSFAARDELPRDVAAEE